MKILGNIIWLVFGGLECAVGYFTGSLALACTIIGIPWAWQTFRLGLLCLWPFGSSTESASSAAMGCLFLQLDLIWLIFGGFLVLLSHLFWGCVLCITIVGIPWGRQHFKMMRFALSPFGRRVSIGL